MVTSPSTSSRIFFCLPNHSVEHLQCYVNVKFRHSEIQFSNLLSFSSETVVDLDSAALAPCSPSPPPCPLHRTSIWHLADVGDEQQKVRRLVTDASGGFAAARERRGADGATQRRPNHRSSPRGLPLPRTRCHSRREPQGAERALCRRRARAATPPWTGAVTPRPAEISGGMTPVTSTDAAWPPKPPANPLHRRNCSPEILRSRPPRRSAYK